MRLTIDVQIVNPKETSLSLHKVHSVLDGKEHDQTSVSSLCTSVSLGLLLDETGGLQRDLPDQRSRVNRRYAVALVPSPTVSD